MTLKFGCFVTGTDTNVGKTLIAAALLHRCVARGWRSIGMKPVAAGCQLDAQGQGGHEDVATLCAASNMQAAMEDINPYVFREAIAPHLAAQHEGVTIEPARILSAYARLASQADALVVEGAGGFVIPLDMAAGFNSADLAFDLALPVVLTVGMRLGCLNHALLTQEVIAARGLKLAGWVANTVDPAMPCFDENLHTLRSLLQAPLLGVVPFMRQPDARQVAEYLVLPEVASS